ncbi:MAG TPA: hypothetical protein VFC07_13330 [Verrucomicrobiae bacterium]|nr:hypothetical protein [Verrucomicrobiae bacterium]
MNEDEAIDQMRSVLSLNSDSNDLTNCIVALNEKGISKERIYELLQSLREEFSDGRDEVKEDAILETMDYVWHEMK